MSLNDGVSNSYVKVKSQLFPTKADQPLAEDVNSKSMRHNILKSIIKSMKKNWVLYLVILFSLFIRIFQLTQYPPILNRDEAALAFNAKLILESGKDEWGETYPLQFKSFGDYKLPGYIYALVPLFKIFGENDFIVRLPSALAGLGIVIVGSFLTKELFNLKSTKHNMIVALIIFSVTPVFFFYSRMAWEANIALFLFLSSLYISLRNKNSVVLYDVLSGLLLVFAILTYNTPLLLLPFCIPLVVLHRGVAQTKKWVLPFILWSLIFIFGAILLFSVATQKSGITIFSDETTELQYPVFRQQFPASLQTMLGNKYAYWFSIMMKKYVLTFSPNFLVMHGGSHPWHSILGRGHIYRIEYLGFLIGFITLINKSVKSLLRKKWKQLIIAFTPIYLLLISPLPAVITVDAPHATRSLFTFFMIIGFSIYGFLNIFTVTFVKKYSKLFTIVFGSCIFIETLIYGYQYFEIWPNVFPAQLNVGFDQVIHRAETDFPEQKKVVLDDEGYLYVLTSWYANIDYNTFSGTVNKHLPDKIGLQYGYKVGEYRFVKSIDDRIEGENIVILRKDNEWGIEVIQ